MKWFPGNQLWIQPQKDITGGEILGENEIGNYIMHGGDYPGYHTMLFRYLDSDITIVVLSNNESNSTMLAGTLAYIITDRKVVAPYIHRAVIIDTVLLDRYVGKYITPNVPNVTNIELFKKEGRLFYRYENGKIQTELKPELGTKFFVSGNDQQINFEVDAGGKVLKAFSIYNGMKKEIKKTNTWTGSTNAQ